MLHCFSWDFAPVFNEIAPSALTHLEMFHKACPSKAEEVNMTKLLCESITFAD